MTDDTGAGDGSPPVVADDVCQLLLKHLGDDAPVDLMEVPFLAYAVNKAQLTGELPIRGSGPLFRTSPEVRAIHEAQRTLAKLLPAELEAMQAMSSELRDRLRGHPNSNVDAFEERVGRARRLLDAVNATIPDIPDRLPSLMRKRDVRSEWHPTARMFANLIKAGYQKAGGEQPSLLSQSSPLVLAVQALLEWVGQRHDGDTIRQALGKYRD